MLYERRALGVLYVCEGVSFVNAGALKYLFAWRMPNDWRFVI